MAIFRLEGVNPNGRPFKGVPQMGILINYMGANRWANGPKTMESSQWRKGQDVDIIITENNSFLNFTINSSVSGRANNNIAQSSADKKNYDEAFGKCKTLMLQQAFIPFINGELPFDSDGLEQYAEQFAEMCMRKIK